MFTRQKVAAFYPLQVFERTNALAMAEAASQAHIESELARAKALRAEAIALRDQGDKRGALTKVREAKEVATADVISAREKAAREVKEVKAKATQQAATQSNRLSFALDALCGRGVADIGCEQYRLRQCERRRRRR